MSLLEKILVVDDEPLVRTLLRRVLADQGFQMLEAASGEEALQIYSGLSNPPTVLLTDLKMPGMGGYSLARTIIEQQPGIRVIYMSGFCNEAEAVMRDLRPGDSFIEKPFSQTILLAKLRMAMMRGSESSPRAFTRPRADGVVESVTNHS